MYSLSKVVRNPIKPGAATDISHAIAVGVLPTFGSCIMYSQTPLGPVVHNSETARRGGKSGLGFEAISNHLLLDFSKLLLQG